jgi:LysM repeat protein
MSNTHQTLNRGLMSTMPIVLIGSLTLATLNLTGAVDVASAAPKKPDAHRSDSGKLTATVRAATVSAVDAAPASADGAVISATSVVVPAHYTVRSGDTVSGIASHYRLSTASVLALNGLSWKSTIFPGQVLKLTKAKASTPAPKPVVTPPPAQQVPPATPAAPSTRYTIKSGDTITAIAKKFGVTVQAVLTANHLNAKSIIYAGRTLIIPGKTAASSSPTTPAVGTQPSQVGTSITPLSPEMKANALTIIAVGKLENVPDYGIIVALAAAAQESGLRDLSGGDLDSVGLFQQRPSAGWGTKSQLQNTTYASELFFGGPSNPNKGKTRGLLDIKGWQSMTLTQAAQAVQVSAHPNAYAKWESSARAWFAALR